MNDNIDNYYIINGMKTKLYEIEQRLTTIETKFNELLTALTEQPKNDLPEFPNKDTDQERIVPEPPKKKTFFGRMVKNG